MTDLRRSTRKTATAHHEAGHAVIACRLGIGLRQIGVTIVPGKDYAGACASRWKMRGRPDVDYSDAMCRSAERQVMVMLAGVEAQRKFNPRSVRRHHGKSDYQHAIDLLDYFTSGPDDLEPYLERLRLQAKELVENHWQDVTRVARALLEFSRWSPIESARWVP